MLSWHQPQLGGKPSTAFEVPRISDRSNQCTGSDAQIPGNFYKSHAQVIGLAPGLYPGFEFIDLATQFLEIIQHSLKEYAKRQG